MEGVEPWDFYPWPQYSVGRVQHMTVFSKVKSKESVMQNDPGTFIYKYSPKSFILPCQQHIHNACRNSFIHTFTLIYKFFCTLTHRCTKGMSFLSCMLCRNLLISLQYCPNKLLNHHHHEDSLSIMG